MKPLFEQIAAMQDIIRGSEPAPARGHADCCLSETNDCNWPKCGCEEPQPPAEPERIPARNWPGAYVVKQPKKPISCNACLDTGELSEGGPCNWCSAGGEPWDGEIDGTTD